MFAALRKLTIALGTVAVLAASSPSYALPVFTEGSFSMVAFLQGPFTDVDTTTSFNLSTPVLTGSPVDDFTVILPPAVLMTPATFNFATGTGFNFSDVGFGSFVATSVTDLPDVQNGFHEFNVIGTFTPGTAWANAGNAQSANMRWSLTQTGDSDDSTSISGSFHSPAQPIPEPASLALMGLGLAAASAVIRRRR